MTAGKVLLSLDQGTTGVRALLYNPSAKVIASAYQEFTQHYPRPGWVEHCPDEIWKVTLKVISNALKNSGLKFSDVAAVSITNQRETTVLWSKKTGRPVYNAIVWQDRRTSEICDRLKKKGLEKKIRAKTGLVLDSYFSATKIGWLLSQKKSLQESAKRGELAFGTIDSWILWKLTGGKAHKTDFTNASRTLLYNIHTREWDKDLMRLFKVPSSILPEVQNSGSFFGETVKQSCVTAGIPVMSMIGDQQAALYGQDCFTKGDIKNTYGTGCFVVMNAGKDKPKLTHGLLTTLACRENGEPCYALEGSIFIGGAVIQWLRDGLRLFENASESESLAQSVPDSNGVTLIPAFVGLGSPYWNSNVRGTITGITRGVTSEHLTRAALEAIAHQSSDVIEAMQKSSKNTIKNLKVDGGATQNGLLMQIQSDLLQKKVLASNITETTAWGAAKLAGKMISFWKGEQFLKKAQTYKIFSPKLSSQKAGIVRSHWKSEVNKLISADKS